MYNFENQISELKKSGLLRKLEIAQGIDFCSNDYLGLSLHRDLKKSLISFIEGDNKLFSPSSRLICGTEKVHLDIEEWLAIFLKREASLLFSSGYAANSGVISSICRNGIIFSDQYNHASIIDGIKLAKSPYHIYPHNDLNALEDLIRKNSHRRGEKYIITETVFSMNGVKSDLKRILEICETYNAFLIVDEAHSTGVYGNDGEGLLASHTFTSDRVISVHTGGKALGVAGAFIGCSKVIKQYLINKCRHFIYSTSLLPINTFLIQASTVLVQNSDNLRKKLQHNITYFNRSIGRDSYPDTPIIPYYLAGNRKAIKFSEILRKEKINVKAIRYPTVAKGHERLRISIHANHSFDQLNELANRLKTLAKDFKNA